MNGRRYWFARFMLLTPIFGHAGAQGSNSNHSQNVSSNNGVMLQNNTVVIKELKQQAITNNISPKAYLQILVPAHEKSPHSECEEKTSVPSSAMRVYFTNGLSWSDKSDFSLVTARSSSGTEVRLLWVRREGKVLVIGARIFNAEGKIVLALDDSQPHLNVSEVFEVKRPDSHTLEVTNTRDERVLRLDFLNENAIVVEGMFYPPSVDGHAAASPPIKIGGALSFQIGSLKANHICAGEVRNVFVVDYQ